MIYNMILSIVFANLSISIFPSYFSPYNLFITSQGCVYYFMWQINKMKQESPVYFNILSVSSDFVPIRKNK